MILLASMDDLIKYVLGEVRVIREAPLLFLTALLVLGALLIGVMRVWYGDQISSLHKRIQLRDDKLSEFQEKLKTSSPDEAKARLDALESALANLARDVTPRRLTSEQAKRLANEVRLPPGVQYQIDIINDMACGDCQSYANALRAVFNDVGGWTVRGPGVIGPGQAPRSGLAVLALDLNKLRPAEALVAKALREAGLLPELSRAPVNPIDQPDVSILITAEANG